MIDGLIDWLIDCFAESVWSICVWSRQINMGENATTVAVDSGAVDVWTNAKLKATEPLRPHASLLYTLPKTQYGPQ